MKYNKEWYDSLNKPFYQPPAWIFSPTWMLLYFSMLCAFILVLSKGFSYLALLAYFLFFIQLGTNLSWPVAFFKEHNLKKSFYISLILWILVFATMMVFFIVSKISGILMLPYFAWCSFATILSYDILRLNPNM